MDKDNSPPVYSPQMLGVPPPSPTPSQVSVVMQPRPVMTWMYGLVWFLLSVGVGMNAVGYVAQLSFLNSNYTIPQYARDILHWTDEDYRSWHASVYNYFKIATIMFVFCFIVLAVFIVLRGPGRMWCHYEAGAVSSGKRKKNIYWTAALLASIVACIVSFDEFFSFGPLPWVLSNTVPNVVLVAVRLMLRKGIVAPIVSTALFSVLTFLLISTGPSASKASSLGKMTDVKGLKAVNVKAVKDLVTRMDFPLDDVYVMEGNNAFFSGSVFGKVMMIGKQILDDDCKECLEAVTAHELGHWKNNHMLPLIADKVVSVGIRAMLPWALATEKVSWMLQTVGATSVAYPFGMGIVVAPLVSGAIHFAFKPLMLLVSRMCEYQADENSFELGFAAGLAKFFRNNMIGSSGQIIHPVFEALNMTHPESVKRVKRADEYLAK